MLYNIPSQISTEKDKVHTKVELWVEFNNLPSQANSRRYSNTADRILVDSGSDGVVSGGTYFSAASAELQTDNSYYLDIIEIVTNAEEEEIFSINSDTACVLNGSLTNGSSLSWRLWHIRRDNLMKNATINIGVKMNELVNGLSSTGNTAFSLVPFSTEMESAFIGSLDIIDADIDMWFKFNDGTTEELSDSMRIFRGRLSEWSVTNNIMSFKVDHKEEDLAKIPGTLLKDVYDFYEGPAEYACQIQFGDFNWNNDFQYYADWGEYNLAPMIWVGKDIENNLDVYHVACHDMTNIPTTTNYEENIFATGNDYNDPWAFIYVEGHWCPCSLAFGEEATVYNSTNCCYITVDDAINRGFTQAGFFMHKLTDQYTTGTTAALSNDVAGWANCVDGRSTTTDSTSDDESLSLQTTDESTIGPLKRTDSRTIYLVASFGTIDVTGGNPRLRIYDKAAEGLQASLTLQGGMSNSTQYISLASVTNINSYFFNIGGGGTGSHCEVKNVTVWDPLHSDYNQNLLVNPIIYTRAQGRNYSSQWIGLTGSRKTAGALITNPSDAFESLLWDDLGFIGQTSTNDGKIETQSFEDVEDIFSTASINVCGSIYEQQDAWTLLKAICRMFNFNLSYTMFRRWRLHFPQAAEYDFESSGSGTPNNEDIFTDEDTKNNAGVYDQHPIVKNSFQLLRSNKNEKYNRLDVGYGRVDGQYRGSVTTGSGKTYTINNFLISDFTNATNLRNLLDGWLLASKAIVKFETWFNACTHELGDIINVRHDWLSDAMLDATVNTQKWMIIEKNFKWRPPFISIKAIELL